MASVSEDERALLCQGWWRAARWSSVWIGSFLIWKKMILVPFLSRFLSFYVHFILCVVLLSRNLNFLWIQVKEGKNWFFDGKTASIGYYIFINHFTVSQNRELGGGFGYWRFFFNGIFEVFSLFYLLWVWFFDCSIKIFCEYTEREVEPCVFNRKLHTSMTGIGTQVGDRLLEILGVAFDLPL